MKGTRLRIAIIGSGGMLGHDLCKVFPEAVRFDHRTLDITMPSAVKDALRNFDVIINAAAYTDVARAETDKMAARLVNAVGSENLARASGQQRSVLVHFSSNYVFAGRKKTGYRETDRCRPINQYGRTKLEGERAIRRYCRKHYIIRTSNLFGRNRKNLVDRLAQSMRRGHEVEMISDHSFSPTYTMDLADFVRKTILPPSGKGGREDVPTLPFGTYHATNAGVASPYSLAKEISRTLGLTARITPITLAQSHAKVRLPRNGVLLNTKTAPLPHWKDALRRYLARGRAKQ